MSDEEIKKRANKEKNRIKRILTDAGISDRRMKLLEPVIANTSWMKAKLDDSMEAIKNSQVVISYNNGGGQKGIHENPLFKGYENLWRAYMQGMDKILSCLPEDVIEKETKVVEKPKTMLELVRNKHKKDA